MIFTLPPFHIRPARGERGPLDYTPPLRRREYGQHARQDYTRQKAAPTPGARRRFTGRRGRAIDAARRRQRRQQGRIARRRRASSARLIFYASLFHRAHCRAASPVLFAAEIRFQGALQRAPAMLHVGRMRLLQATGSDFSRTLVYAPALRSRAIQSFDDRARLPAPASTAAGQRVYGHGRFELPRNGYRFELHGENSE